ncbi:tetratricopeptide repeat domain protein [Xylogone sp. PMI_703]|nr:tetratricopeptide repeat domain protein [Xylogone sp. PMI_703]
MGLVVLYPDENNTEINARLGLDIVAVHGLNGDQFRTWTEPTSEKLWLRDFLPKDIPLARIMTFGYDASPLTNTDAGIEEHAIDLLRSVATLRAQNGDQNRPLLFMGHSLGGIVIKTVKLYFVGKDHDTALITARQNSEVSQGYREIDDNTIGIIFYGTPHKGSDMATFAETLSRAPKYVTPRNRSTLLKALRKGSGVLKKIEDDFLAHEWTKPYKFVSFYETKRTMGFAVVEKSSAVLNQFGSISFHEEQIPVPADHRDICRYSSKDDETYLRSVESIKQICRETVIPPLRHEHYVVASTVNENFTGREEILQQLKSRFIDDRYLPSKFQQRFVLYGLGGAGKTQTSLKFIDIYKERFSGVFWIDASSLETIKNGYLEIARSCGQDENIGSVRDWLSGRDHWLIIMDNADDPQLDISRFFPAGNRGSIIITTRCPELCKYASTASWTYRVDRMSTEDAISLLLRVAGEDIEDGDKRHASEQIVSTLGYFALAIVQAGIIIRKKISSLAGFIELFDQQKEELLNSDRVLGDIDYQFSVYTTWEISIQRIEQMKDKYSALALELLGLFSFLHFDGITKTIFQKASEDLQYRPLVGYASNDLVEALSTAWDPLTFQQALSLLYGFSLIDIDESERISMHPLVHEWSRTRMGDSERNRLWQVATMILARSIDSGMDSSNQQYRKLLLPHIDQCIATSEGRLISEGPQAAEMMDIMGKFEIAYMEATRYYDALNLLIQMEEKCRIERIREERPIALTTVQLHTCICLEGLGHHKEVLELLDILLEETKRTHGESSWQVYDMKGRIAVCNFNMGEYDKAIPLYQEVYEASLERFGLQHILTVTALIGLAGCYGYTKKFGKSAKLHRKAFENCRKVYGDQHSVTLNEMSFLAESYANQRKYKKSRKLQEQCVAQLNLLLGEDHHQTIYALNTLATCYRHTILLTGWGKTVRVRKQALAKMQNAFGSNDLRTIGCMRGLAADYSHAGQYEKAIEFQNKALQKLMDTVGPEHRHTKEAVKELSNIKIFREMNRTMWWWVPKQMRK